MSHFRKNRKIGGFEYTPSIYHCGVKTVRGRQTKVPISQCIREFAAANNFTIVETADDGNCFYDTLSKYGQRTGNARLNKTHLALRREIIGAMMTPERLAELAPFFVENVAVAPNAAAIQVDPVAQLRRFLQPYQWVGWMGDIVPQVAAEILGINIEIYDARETEPSNMIDRLVFAGGAGPTVTMLRTGGNHFRLLWPRPAAAPGAAAAPRRRPVVAPGSRVTAKKPNAVANATKAMANMKLANKPTGPATRSKARAAAATKNNVTKRRASLGSKPSSLGSRRSSLKSNSNSSFEKEMRRAIEASKRVEVIARGAENAAKKAEMAAKKEAAKAKIAAKKAENAVKKAAKKAANNEERREAEELQRAIAESLKPTTMPGSFF